MKSAFFGYFLVQRRVGYSGGLSKFINIFDILDRTKENTSPVFFIKLSSARSRCWRAGLAGRPSWRSRTESSPPRWTDSRTSWFSGRPRKRPSAHRWPACRTSTRRCLRWSSTVRQACTSQHLRRCWGPWSRHSRRRRQRLCPLLPLLRLSCHRTGPVDDVPDLISSQGSATATTTTIARATSCSCCCSSPPWSRPGSCPDNFDLIGCGERDVLAVAVAVACSPWTCPSWGSHLPSNRS